MRLLLDENVGSRRWAVSLRVQGHDVERVVDVGLQGKNDAEVVAYAEKNRRALISRDIARKDVTDLRREWQQLRSPRPLLLLIFPGEVTTLADITRALGNLEKLGIVDQICAINQWKF